MRIAARWRATLVVSAVAGTLVASGCAVATAGAVAARARGPGGAGAASGGTWGRAIEVPGIRSLNTSGGAGVSSISCTSPGNCGAVGGYALPGHYHQAVFVVSQVRGTWGKAAAMPGLGALNKRRNAGVGEVSCTSRGNCSTGGSYTDGLGHQQAFVASQIRGTWHRPERVPGLAALQGHGGAGVGPVSCASPGNCTAGGSYQKFTARTQSFVVSQVRGTWHTAEPVPGLAALNLGHSDGIASISCASAGNCTAVGSYKDGAKNTQAFAVSQVNGIWSTAIEVPGTAALNTGGYAAAAAVSCGSAGNCTAIGNYSDSVGFEYPFVISQVNGTWGTAAKIPGMTALNKVGAGQGYSISCGSAGDCVAAGSEGVNNGFDVGGGGQPFVATQANGIWGNATLLTGMKRLNTGADGAVTAMSCSSRGNCSAAGYYGVGQPGQKVYNLEVFVVTESRGAWGRAREIPGTAVLNKGQWAGVSALSCAAAGRCSLGGGYTDGSNHGEAFVDTSS